MNKCNKLNYQGLSTG